MFQLVNCCLASLSMLFYFCSTLLIDFHQLEGLIGLVLDLQETTIFLQLKIMVIEDMIYIIHVKGLAEHTSLSLNFQPQLFFVDLEQDPPKVSN